MGGHEPGSKGRLMTGPGHLKRTDRRHRRKAEEIPLKERLIGTAAGVGIGVICAGFVWLKYTRRKSLSVSVEVQIGIAILCVVAGALAGFMMGPKALPGSRRRKAPREDE